jgi:hypothetical protein
MRFVGCQLAFQNELQRAFVFHRVSGFAVAGREDFNHDAAFTRTLFNSIANGKFGHRSSFRLARLSHCTFESCLFELLLIQGLARFAFDAAGMALNFRWRDQRDARMATLKDSPAFGPSKSGLPCYSAGKSCSFATAQVVFADWNPLVAWLVHRVHVAAGPERRHCSPKNRALNGPLIEKQI